MAVFSKNVTISNFSNNSAEAGGAIVAPLPSSNLSISHCALLNNSANSDSEAINSQDGSVSISDSKLAYNSAERSGGAILVFNGELLISDSKLTNNNAAFGGAIGIFI